VGFFKEIKPAINKVLNELFSDEELRTEIEYQKKGVTIGWDDDLRQNIVSREKHTIYAILLKHNKKTVAQSKSANVQVGDRLYMIRYQDAPTGMSLNDQIIHDGQTLDIKAIDQIFTFAYSITVEGS
jgi:hypothetical protein